MPLGTRGGARRPSKLEDVSEAASGIVEHAEAGGKGQEKDAGGGQPEGAFGGEAKKSDHPHTAGSADVAAVTTGASADPGLGGTKGLATMDPEAPDHHPPMRSGQDVSHVSAITHGRRSDVHRRFLPAIQVMTFAEIIAYLLVAITLLVMALVVIYRGGDDVFRIIVDYVESSGTPATPIIDALSNFLFVVILMELLATLITHIRHETFQVKPFIIIGIISGVRQILLLGARLSLNSTMSSTEWRHSQIELGVNVGIDLLLIIGLVLLKHYKVESDHI